MEREALFLSLKEKGRMMSEKLRRNPPIVADLNEVLTNIDEYRGRTVRVEGVVEYENQERVSRVHPLSVATYPLIEEGSHIQHRLYADDNGELGEGFSILTKDFRSVDDAQRHEGRVAVTGRIRTEVIREKGGNTTDEQGNQVFPNIGTVKALRPYIQYPKIEPLE